MEDTIVYTPLRKMVWFQVIAPIMGAVIAVAISGGIIFFVVTALNTIENAPFPVFIIMGVFLLGAVGLGYAGVSSAISAFRERASGNERVMLGSDAIVYSDANGETTLRLRDIVALESVWVRSRTDPDDYSSGHWTFSVRDCHDQKLEFDSAGPRHLFDPRPIFRDLMTRLPQTVPVGPNLLNYVQTGDARESAAELQAPVFGSSLKAPAGEEPIVYLPNRAVVAGQDFILKIALVVGSVFSGVFLLCVLSQILPELMKTSLPVWIPIVGVLILLLIAVGTIFPMLSAFLKRPTGNERVILSREAITYRDAKGDTTLRLADIVAMDGKWTRPYTYHSARHHTHTHQSGYWTFIIKDCNNQKIELRAGVETFLFDAHPILHELVMRLPGPIPVNPYLADYVQTGQVRTPGRKKPSSNPPTP